MSAPESTAVHEKASAARAAARIMAQAPHSARVKALETLAALLHREGPRIMEENHADYSHARLDGLAKPLLDRLKLTPEKVETLSDGVRQVARLPDPVDRTLRATKLDDGLELYQVTTPIGVLACVFESRPDAVVQIASLAVKSGNAVLLKGGAEAEHSNGTLAELVRQALATAGLPEDAVQLLHGRSQVTEVLKLDHLVDIVIPRGSSAFVRHVMDSTRIPVLGHAEGVCHVYVDKDADVEKALRIALDAKLEYPAACNAVECFLVHEKVAQKFIPDLAHAFSERGVELRADEASRAIVADLKAASPEDWGREFGDLVASIRVVSSTEEAIRFVNRHGSRHTDAIVTEDSVAARAFVRGVDAAGVYVNASTRFADGYRYGLGAEVGVSTAKVHARGPVGIEGLVVYKWVLAGDGQAASDYGPGRKAFRHEPLDTEKPPFWEG